MTHSQLEWKVGDLLKTARAVIAATIDNSATRAHLARKLHIGRINRSQGQRWRRVYEACGIEAGT